MIEERFLPFLEAAHTIVAYTNREAQAVKDPAERRRRFLPEAEALAGQEWLQVVVGQAARAERDRVLALLEWRHGNDLREAIGEPALPAPRDGVRWSDVVMDATWGQVKADPPAEVPRTTDQPAVCACAHYLTDHGSEGSRLGCRAPGCACFYLVVAVS